MTGDCFYATTAKNEPGNIVCITVQQACADPKVLTSSDLLGGSKTIIIKHAGEEYRLSITSKDKLILTK